MTEVRLSRRGTSQEVHTNRRPLNPRGRESLAVQLAHQLRAEIDAGCYQPDEALPSEQELCDAFAVSRNTVRRALAIIRDEGLVETIKQRGTYVVDGRPNGRTS